MNIVQYALTVLAEECSETAQRCAKAIRFGLTEIQLGQKETNLRRLERELADLIATAEFLRLRIRAKDKAAKRRKLETYMDYSRKLGILD